MASIVQELCQSLEYHYAEFCTVCSRESPVYHPFARRICKLKEAKKKKTRFFIFDTTICRSFPPLNQSQNSFDLGLLFVAIDVFSWSSDNAERHARNLSPVTEVIVKSLQRAPFSLCFDFVVENSRRKVSHMKKERAPLAQWLERLPPEEEVVSSNLARRCDISFVQIDERKRRERKTNASYWLRIALEREGWFCGSFLFLTKPNHPPPSSRRTKAYSEVWYVQSVHRQPVVDRSFCPCVPVVRFLCGAFCSFVLDSLSAWQSMILVTMVSIECDSKSENCFDWNSLNSSWSVEDCDRIPKTDCSQYDWWSARDRCAAEIERLVEATSVRKRDIETWCSISSCERSSTKYLRMTIDVRLDLSRCHIRIESHRSSSRGWYPWQRRRHVLLCAKGKRRKKTRIQRRQRRFFWSEERMSTSNSVRNELSAENQAATSWSDHRKISQRRRREWSDDVLLFKPMKWSFWSQRRKILLQQELLE